MLKECQKELYKKKKHYNVYFMSISIEILDHEVHGISASFSRHLVHVKCVRVGAT